MDCLVSHGLSLALALPFFACKIRAGLVSQNVLAKIELSNFLAVSKKEPLAFVGHVLRRFLGFGEALGAAGAF